MKLILVLSLLLSGCISVSVNKKQPPKETVTELQVRELVKKEGIHVVHFWAPWCSNSLNELKGGWYELIEEYADSTNVDFTFVTIWNDNQSGRAAMTQHAVPENVIELTQPDLGSSELKANRRYTFMGLPVTWIPTTWIFNRNGKLAYAFNFGEQSMPALKAAIEDAKKDW